MTVAANGGSFCGTYVPATRSVENSWKLRSGPVVSGYTSTTTLYGPGLVNVIVWLIVPSAAIGGC